MAKGIKELQAQIDAFKNEAMNDSELDNVTGGTTQENWQIVNVMAQVDPSGTQKMLHELNEESPVNLDGRLRDKLTILINKNFRDKGINVNYSGSTGVANMYSIDGKKVSHTQFLAFLDGCKKTGDDF